MSGRFESGSDVGVGGKWVRGDGLLFDLTWGELVLGFGLLFLVLMRALISFTPQVYWTMDPRAEEVVMSSFGPLGTGVTNTLGVMLCVGSVCLRFSQLRVQQYVMLLCWLVYGGWIYYHARVSMDALVEGSTWFATVGFGLCGYFLSMREGVRRVLMVGVFAVLPVFAIQAVYQSGVEVPRTIEHYEAHRAEELQRRGWKDGSTQVKQYERRLYGQDATARFTLANVFASVLVGLLGVGGGVMVGVLRHRRGLPGGLCVWIGVVCLGGVVALGLTFSKGAVLALGLSGCLVGGWVWLNGRNRMWGGFTRGLVYGVVLLGIVVVLVRGGVVGVPETAEGERSLLFRYFYWEAGVRMVVDHPVVGVGPGGFGEAYLTYKNPLSPEDVADPHNVFMTNIASLGVGAVAFVVLMLMWMWGIGGRLMGLIDQREVVVEDDTGKVGSSEAGEDDGGVDLPGRLMFGVLVLSLGLFCIDFYVRRAEMFYESALVWLATLLAFIGTFVGVLKWEWVLNDKWVGVGVVIGGMGVLLHNQIDLGMVHLMAGPVLFVLVGMCAAPVERSEEKVVAG